MNLDTKKKLHEKLIKIHKELNGYLGKETDQEKAEKVLSIMYDVRDCVILAGK